MGAGRPRGDAERLLLGLLAVLRLDIAVLHHAIDHVVAPLESAIALAKRVQEGRRLRQRRQIGGIRDRELVHRLVEIKQRGGRHPIGPETEIDLVEIKLEDLLLRISALDLERQQRLLDLALERHLVGQQEILGDLLGDGRGALRAAVGTVILEVEHAGARDAAEIEPAMFIEILVLGRHEGVEHQLWHRLDRQVEPALARIFGQQRAVGRVHAGHDARLVVLQLAIIGQILGEMPDQAGSRTDPDQEHDGSECEQESEEAKEQPHRVPSVNCAPAGARRPPPGRPESKSSMLSRAPLRRMIRHSPDTTARRPETMPQQGFGRPVLWSN